MARSDLRIDAIIMVGGFSGSEYLYTRVQVWLISVPRWSSILQQQFNNRVRVITRPSDAGW